MQQTGKEVAIKKVLRRFKNRELQIMKMLDHVNDDAVPLLLHSGDKPDETYLNLVMDCAQTVWDVAPLREEQEDLPLLP